jgi:hypothetical protein
MRVFTDATPPDTKPREKKISITTIQFRIFTVDMFMLNGNLCFFLLAFDHFVGVEVKVVDESRNDEGPDVVVNAPRTEFTTPKKGKATAIRRAKPTTNRRENDVRQ